MTTENDYKMISETLGRIRIIAALIPLENDKRMRAFEIINELDDMYLEDVKKHLEILDLADELSKILNEHGHVREEIRIDWT